MVFDRDKHSVLAGITYRIETPCGSAYVTVNRFEGQIVEVFAHLGKSGGCASCNINAICRIISIALQNGVSPERIIKQLIGNQCEKTSVSFESMSCPDAIGKILEREMKNYETNNK